MCNLFEVYIIDIVIAEWVNEFLGQEYTLHMIINDCLKLLPVSELRIVSLWFLLQDRYLTRDVSQIILEMIDDALDLSEDLLGLVEFTVQNSHLLVYRQKVSDAIIFKARKFLFYLFRVSSDVKVLFRGHNVWQEIVVLLLLLHI